jgi:chromate transporter
MAVVTWRLGLAALVDWTTVAMLIASLILLIRFRLNSAWLVLIGGLAGLVFRLD